MKFGLEQHIIDKLVAVFEQHSKVDKALVFGSRAKGNYRPDSDIDIAIKGQDLSTDDIIAMSVAFEEKVINHKIDLINYHSIKEPDLKDHIDRVGIELYSRWKEFKFSEIATFSQGIQVDPQYQFSKPFAESVRFIRIVDFTKSGTEEFRYIKNPGERYLVEVDDLVMIRYGSQTAGKIAKGFKGAIANNTFKISVDNSILEKTFIFYYLSQRQIFEFFHFSQASSTMPAITFEMIGNLEILVPPLCEQTAIASILSSLDDKIDLLHRQNKTLEQLAETLFRQWFVEGAEESWENKKLGELVTITSSKRIFYSEYVSYGIPFYRSKEIIELRKSGSTNSELYISKERFDEINNKFGSPIEGDILMTSVGTLGVAYRVRKSDKFYFKDGNLTWFKDFKGLPSSIIYLWLISKIGQEELAAITIGSTQEALTIEGLKGISFKIPPKEKIKDYELEFNSIIEKIESNQTQIRTLTQTRDTLLPKLMNGEVRVNLE